MERYLIYLLVLLAAGGPANAVAQVNCSDIFEVDYFNPLLLPRDQWIERFQEQVQLDVAEVHLLTGQLGLNPIPLVFVPSIPLVNSHFAMNEGTVRLGIHDVGNYNQGVRAVVGHEAGHSIFTNNLQVRLWGSFKTVMEHYRDHIAEFQPMLSDPQYVEIKSQITNLQQLIDEVVFSGNFGGLIKLKAIARSIEKYSRRLRRNFPFERFEKQERELLALKEEIAPYNELFADIVAVYLTGNPSIIAETTGAHTNHQNLQRSASNNPGSARAKDYQTNPHADRMRDFEALLVFKGWQYDVGEEERSSGRAFNPYSALDPVRGVLWKMYLKNLPKEEFPAFLKAFILASQDHLQVRWFSQRANSRYSAETMNRDFLYIIRQQLEAAGIRPQK